MNFEYLILDLQHVIAVRDASGQHTKTETYLKVGHLVVEVVARVDGTHGGGGIGVPRNGLIQKVA
jgi:hypothetical protein